MPDLDIQLVAVKVKHRREALGLTQQEVAEATGLSRQTIAKIEKGEPVKRKSLTVVFQRLKLYSDQFQPSSERTDKFSVHRSERTNWMVSLPRKSYSKVNPGEDLSHVQDPKERKRLGRLGFQPFFTAILESELPDGVMGHAMMELHKPSWIDSHFGEEFVFCLRGEVKITVDGVECQLSQGDSMCFDAWLPHLYAPAVNPGPNEEAPLILLVVAERPYDKVLRRAHFIKHPRSPGDIDKHQTEIQYELENDMGDKA